MKIKYITTVMLIGIFFCVLFFNTYWNATSGVGLNPDGETFEEKYYLSGPDPYYNARTIRQMIETGGIPSGPDPLLNYPLGVAGSSNAGRPPLFNMITIGFSSFLQPFMPIDDAIGLSMQFIPALFGALLVIPVYFIGKTLFNRKTGLISALFVALIPIHIASGHGSAYTLFDHDSFVLLLVTTIYMLFLFGINSKTNKKSILYGAFAGVGLGALSFTWVEARYAFAVLAVYFIIQLFINLLRTRYDTKFLLTSCFTFIVGIGLFAIYHASRGTLTFRLPILLTCIVLGLTLFQYAMKKYNIPWILSIPSLCISGGIFTGFVFLLKDAGIPAVNKIYSLIAGSGIYGSEVSLTIAEAGTFNISRTVMSFGPAMLWFAFAALCFLMYKWTKNRNRSDYVFIIIIFLISLWFLSIAGRFINDLVPVVALMCGWMVYLLVEKANFPKMIKRIKAIGGLRGVRHGIKLPQTFTFCCVAFLLILPNAYMCLNYAVPIGGTYDKVEMFGEKNYDAGGLVLYKEKYWTDAFMWLNDQDIEIENPQERPGFISWWDYGFYEVAIGGHPTVADNFQEGIPCAANFKTSETEEEAISVLIVRLCEGNMEKNSGNYLKGTLSSDVHDIIEDYLGCCKKPGTKLINILENPEEYASSYGKPVAPEYGNTQLKISLENARYQDAVKLITDNLELEQIVKMYKAIEDATGFSIRYYGVEGYDLNIFTVFDFLSDKGTYGFATVEDRYYTTIWVDVNGKQYTEDQLDELSRSELQELNPKAQTMRKDAYYNSMIYRAYKGGKDIEMPGYGLKHFFPSYISPYPYPGTQYPAVVILEYFPGAVVTGVVSYENITIRDVAVVVFDEYGIPHDLNITNQMGEFNVVVPAGNVTLRAIVNETISQDVTINATEDEANRIGEYTKHVDIVIKVN